MIKRESILLFVFHLLGTITLISTLNVSEWVEPDHCTLSSWFRYTILAESNIVTITYVIFAWLFRFKWRNTFKRITGNVDFGDSLAIVFFICACCHFIHGFAYISKYVKPLSLIFYPPLIYYLFRLIRMSNKVDKRLNKIKTPEEYDVLKKDLLTLLQKQTILTIEKFAKGHQKIYFEDLANITKNEWQPFSPGCDGILISSDSNNYTFACVMTPPKGRDYCELDRHEHPDVDETFYIEEGELHCLFSGIVIKKGEDHTFKAGTPHHPVTYFKTKMRITGSRVIENT